MTIPAAAADNWARIWRDIRATLLVFLMAVLVGMAVAAGYAADRPSTLLWALACLGLGSLSGFLFGIPKVLQTGGPMQPKPGKENESQDLGLAVNTNLEQISDWITKIIIGLTLVQFDRFRQAFWGLAWFIASGIGVGARAHVFAAALIIYFAVVGFFGGYLLTRMYLAQAFRRADWGASHTVSLAGSELTLAEVTQQQQVMVADLQEQVVRLQHGTSTQSIARGQVLANARSILWVDDHPKNNAFLADQLIRLGVKVVNVTSTTAALTALNSQSFDQIISDMGRQEGAEYNEDAGLDLVRAVREKGVVAPIIIYCSRNAEARYRSQAIALGAEEVTSSPTTLLGALNRRFAVAEAKISEATVGGS